MTKPYTKLFEYCGTPLFIEADWVGFVLRTGIDFAEKWLLKALSAEEVSGKNGLTVHKLSQSTNIFAQDNISSLAPLQILPETVKERYLEYLNYGFDHFLTCETGDWLMILPWDEQEDGHSYAIWAGKKSVWQALEKTIRSIPVEPNPAYQTNNDLCGYARYDLFLSDRPELPRNIALSLRHAKFVDE
jgi:hypothetical protein